MNSGVCVCVFVSIVYVRAWIGILLGRPVRGEDVVSTEEGMPSPSLFLFQSSVTVAVSRAARFVFKLINSTVDPTNQPGPARFYPPHKT